MSGLLLAPLVIPLVVMGISLLILFNTIGIPLSPYTVAIGHVVIALPFAILTMVPRLERIPAALEEASRDLGATAMTTFRLITFPLLLPALISAALISFTISFDEVVISSFVIGTQVTFPVYLYSQLRFPERLPSVIAVAVVILVGLDHRRGGLGGRAVPVGTAPRGPDGHDRRRTRLAERREGMSDR